MTLDYAIDDGRLLSRNPAARTKAALRRFSDQLNRSQVLDLRYAIAGVGFCLFGAVLNFCT